MTANRTYIVLVILALIVIAGILLLLNTEEEKSAVVLENERIIAEMAQEAVEAGRPQAEKGFSIVPVGTGRTGTGRADVQALVLGDQKYSTTSPQVGYIYSCQSDFNGRGAFNDGEWIDTDAGTYDVTAKPSVDGLTDWESATVEFTIEDTMRIVQGNGVPTTHGTGDFPVSEDDDAYAYDRNPNTVSEQSVMYTFPANPVAAASASCVGLGPIGIALNGVAIFNGFDALARDAVAYEIQDSCSGHPERSGEYHYHSGSSCFEDILDSEGHSALYGYVLDGFGLYGKQSGGEYVNNSDLDSCHGHEHTITWDGVEQKMYHYHLTDEYPYTIGCYKGEVEQKAGSTIEDDVDGTLPPSQEEGGSAVPRAGGGPPQEAIAACADAVQGGACAIATPQGNKLGTCLVPPSTDTLACVPQ